MRIRFCGINCNLLHFNLRHTISEYGSTEPPLNFGFFRNVLVVFIWLKMNMLGGRTRRKPENIDGFLNSTAGGRELRLKARPPACLIQWRMPLPSDSRGFCLWFSRTMAAGGSSTLWGKGDYPQWKTPRTFLKRQFYDLSSESSLLPHRPENKTYDLLEAHRRTGRALFEPSIHDLLWLGATR